jgi:hypothetical protein
MVPIRCTCFHTGGVTQAVERPLCTCKALSSNPNTTTTARNAVVFQNQSEQCLLMKLLYFLSKIRRNEIHMYQGRQKARTFKLQSL